MVLLHGLLLDIISKPTIPTGYVEIMEIASFYGNQLAGMVTNA
jgi:hypothetical protein